MRSAFVVVVAIAAALLLIALTSNRRHSVFPLGVAPKVPVVNLDPSQKVCQGPIHVPAEADFDRVQTYLGTYFRPSGPRMRIVIESYPSGQELTSGTIAGGYPDIAQAPPLAAQVGNVHANQRIWVCVENDGDAHVAVFGDDGAASPRTYAMLDGRSRLPADITLVFSRDTDPRLLSLLPTAFRRAALFRVPWFGAWTYWLMLASVLLVAPAALLYAMRAADAPQD
jgi:hypothetical protein